MSNKYRPEFSPDKPLQEYPAVGRGAKRFFHRDQAIAFQGKEKSQLLVVYRFEIFHAAVPAAAGDKSRFKASGQDLG
ncbi:hypothetical protein [Methylobacter sp. BBA5.1]|uniref:hypothetical protein n=1 Tax=Methylobacter sp. BBA5.1 TaxID=1495064 RepID=UPI000565497F|nr:hypothetical protein [Methylobacter sp. BBA5.1]